MEISEIELNFDVDANNVSIRYVQLKRILEYFTMNSSIDLRTEVMEYMQENLIGEIKHIEAIMEQVYDEIKAAETTE